MLTIQKMCEIVGCKEYSYLGDEIFPILFDKERRKVMFLEFLEVERDLSKDWFLRVFAENAASLKSLKQHYTPPEVAELLSRLAGAGNTAADPTGAGTGSLIIAKWHSDLLKSTPFDYKPSDYFYHAEDKSKKNIPFLLFNFMIRGMNAVVIHGDTLTRTAEQVYFIVNEADDFLGFSSLNIMPRSEACESFFDIRGWEGSAIEHKESPNYFL